MQSNFTLSLLITLQIIFIINYQVNPVEIHFFSKSKEDSYQNDKCCHLLKKITPVYLNLVKEKQNRNAIVISTTSIPLVL